VEEEDEPDHRDHGRPRTDGVEPLPRRLARVRDGSQRHDDGDDDEHDRQDEEPPPARQVDQ